MELPIFCGDCVFWDQKTANWGYCRRRSPGSPWKGAELMSISPVTRPDTWCGDGKTFVIDKSKPTENHHGPI